jgi:hypothetical protein
MYHQNTLIKIIVFSTIWIYLSEKFTENNSGNLIFNQILP